MKTLKVLSFIFLGIVVLAHIGIGMNVEYALSDYQDFISRNNPPVVGGGVLLDYEGHLDTVINLGGALGLMVLASPACTLISLVVTIVNRKKYYSGFISGAFQLIPFLLTVWAFLETKSLAADLGYYESQPDNYFDILNYGVLKVFAWLFFFPMAIQFIDAIIKTIRHKQGKDIPDASKKSDVEVLADKLIQNLQPQNAAPAPASVPAPASAAVEIKQYKELLDMGAITQEEFEAKKKQLLGLPVAGGAPAAPQNIGRCVSCGRENVPVETVDVVVAGAVRKRTMCKDCAARYK